MMQDLTQGELADLAGAAREGYDNAEETMRLILACKRSDIKQGDMLDLAKIRKILVAYRWGKESSKLPSAQYI